MRSNKKAGLTWEKWVVSVHSAKIADRREGIGVPDVLSVSGADSASRE